MGLQLSDAELDALDGLPHLHRCLYIFGIRRYMDYATGIVGIKREISYNSLAQEIYVEPKRGVKTSSSSRDQIKRALKILENKGLIKRQSVVTKDEKILILSCPLAMTDKSIQNKAAPWPPHSPALKAAPENESNKNEEKIYKNSVLQDDCNDNKEYKSRPESRPDDFKKPARYPLSVNTKLNSTSARASFLSAEENQFMSLFFDLKLGLKLAGDLKAITAAKNLVASRVPIGVAKEAIEAKLAGYEGNRTPHPSYFVQAVLDYHHDLQNLKQPSEVKSDGQSNRPSKPTRPKYETLVERTKRELDESAARTRKQYEQELAALGHGQDEHR